MPQWVFRHRWFMLGALSAGLLLTFAACGDDEKDTGGGGSPTDTGTGQAAGGPLKIGLLFSYTGGLANFGPEHENAARLAVKHINDGGGVLGSPVELAVADDGTSPTTPLERFCKGVTQALAVRIVDEHHADRAEPQVFDKLCQYDALAGVGEGDAEEEVIVIGIRECG